MADSVGLQISKAVEVRLGVASVVLPSGVKTPPAGLVVVRERISTVMPEDVVDGPLINMSIGAEPRINRDHYKSQMTVRMLELLIGIYADATVIPAADAVDPAYNWLIHSLQSEPTLGGLAHWVSEEASDSAYTTFRDSKAVIGAREVKLQLEYHTRTDDPEVRNI